MKAQKHTPGPWMNPNLSNEVMTIPNGEIKICRVYAILENDRGEANAKLIAAAPELLDALLLIKKFSYQIDCTSESAKKDIKEALMKAELVIKRALL